MRVTDLCKRHVSEGNDSVSELARCDSKAVDIRLGVVAGKVLHK